MHTLQISDGTTTVSLLAAGADGLQLKEAGWAPAVATARQSDLGGIGAWEDVDETITVTAKGATGLADLRTVQRLLDQGRRWARGESVAAVTLRARIDNSVIAGSTALQAAILGGTVALAEDHLDQLFIGEVREATIRLRRRGAWLDPTTESGTATTGLGQIVRTATFSTTHHTASPVEVRITPFDDYGSAFYGLLTAAAASDFTIQEAESGTLSGATSVVVSGARGGSIVRVTQGSASGASGAIENLFAPLAYDSFDLYATVRAVPAASASGPTWDIITTASRLGVSLISEVAVPVSLGRYQVVHLGSFALEGGPESIRMTILRGPGTSLNIGDTFDMDALFAVRQSPYAAALVWGTNIFDSTPGWRTVVTHRPLTRPRASVTGRTAADAIVGPAATLQGDAALMVPPGNALHAVFLRIAPGLASAAWQGLAPNANVGIEAVRHRAYLVLE